MSTTTDNLLIIRGTTLVCCDTSATEVTIPSHVTLIGTSAFYGCANLKVINFDGTEEQWDNIKKDGWDDGWDCQSCQINCLSVRKTKNFNNVAQQWQTAESVKGKVQQPKLDYKPSLKYLTIEGTKLVKCDKSATEIVIPEGVTSIGENAFQYCCSLTSITIPDSVTSIDEYAFEYCSSLASITVAEGNAKYHSDGNCLIETLSKTLIAGCANSIIPTDGSVTSIGEEAFSERSSLASITIPDSVTSIDEYAFYGCSRLASITVAEGNAKYHSDGNCLIATQTKTLIAGCANSIIPTDGSVTSIGLSAFSDCSSLASITISKGVTSIGEYAFYGCSSLKSMTIPDSVTSISASTFYGCSSLESIIVAEGNAKYHSDGNCLIETLSKTLIAGCANSIIPTDGSVTSIGEEAFSDRSSLTSITIPDSVISIGYGAFDSCTSLQSMTIPDSVTSISASTFYGCSSLESITIPNSVTSICEDAFGDCSSLVSITIPDSITTIGGHAFCGCSSLASITISNSVTSIGEWAFGICVSLKDITYNGTKKEWKSIQKDADWCIGVKYCKVHCTNGDVLIG